MLNYNLKLAMKPIQFLHKAEESTGELSNLISNQKGKLRYMGKCDFASMARAKVDAFSLKLASPRQAEELRNGACSSFGDKLAIWGLSLAPIFPVFRSMVVIGPLPTLFGIGPHRN